MKYSSRGQRCLMSFKVVWSTVNTYRTSGNRSVFATIFGPKGGRSVDSVSVSWNAILPNAVGFQSFFGPSLGSFETICLHFSPFGSKFFDISWSARKLYMRHWRKAGQFQLGAVSRLRWPREQCMTQVWWILKNQLLAWPILLLISNFFGKVYWMFDKMISLIQPLPAIFSRHQWHPCIMPIYFTIVMLTVIGRSPLFFAR